MFNLLNVLASLGAFLLLLVLLFIYKFAVRPYMLMKFYEKQGLEICFFPIIGEVKYRFEDVERYGDYYYGHKDKNNQNPKPKAWVSSIRDGPVVLLKDPELIKSYFLLHDRYYIKMPHILCFLKHLSGEGVLFTEGTIWKRHRKLVSTAFNYEFLKEMIPDLVTFTDMYLERLKKKDLSKVDILPEIQTITGELIGVLFFGEDLSTYQYQGQPLTSTLADLLAKTTMVNYELINLIVSPDIVKYGILPSHRQLIRRIRDFKEIMKKITLQKLEACTKSREEGNKKRRVNLIEVFGRQRVENPQDSLTTEEIVDECITFLQAGTDSTGHLLAMSTYYYLVNPQCHRKIHLEVNEIFKDTSDISIEKLNQMDYTNAFMKECLRFAPPAGSLFPREALEDHMLGNIKIKKGTRVNIPFLSNHFDPEYHQEPEKFMPERWIEEGSRTKKTMAENPCLYTPFSGGSRNCIGQHLAMYEAKIIFSLFLKKFDFELLDKNYKLRMTERALHEPLDPIYYRMTAK